MTGAADRRYDPQGRGGGAAAGLATRRLRPQPSIEQRLVLSFNPGETLADASRTAGLVVVSSRSRGGFTGLLLGSTSHTLIHHALARGIRLRALSSSWALCTRRRPHPVLHRAHP
jgi:nucleotide-binding universal stress UspA family protein